MTGPFLFYGKVLLRVLPESDYALALEQLAEALPLEVVAVDRRGLVVVWNRALGASVRPREEALGLPLLDAYPDLAADRGHDWAETVRAALEEGRRTEVPRHPFGDRVVRATVAPILGSRGPAGTPAGGPVIGAVVTLEDITERERSDERRVQRVRSEAVEALGAGLAHEVRNPLNALSLNLQLLREQLEDPASERADLLRKADAMISELARMDGLVTHLLEVSRGGPPARVRTRIDDVVREVVERLQATAAVAGATLTFRPGSSRDLSLDRNRIDRALHNLVRNAIEAVSEEGARRGGHVWVASRDDPNSTVVVVDDDGPGIAPEDRPRLFELFFTRKRHGTGLGLPLARRAVEDHGGALELLPRPGGGTRCVMHLPIPGDAGRRGRRGGEEDAGWPAS